MKTGQRRVSKIPFFLITSLPLMHAYIGQLMLN